MSTLIASRTRSALIAHDQVLAIIARDEFKNRNPLAQEIVRRFDRLKIHLLVNSLIAEGKAELYANLLAKYVPFEGDLVIIEGYGFSKPEISDPFTKILQKRGFIVWLATRQNH
jgi:hypothetical protein